MLQRRIINILIIIAFIILLLVNMQVIFIAAAAEYYVLKYFITAIPIYFIIRELRLWYFRNRIIVMHLNYNVLIMTLILSGISLVLFYVFNLSSQIEFSAFYLISTFLLPVLGLISADQYIFFRKKYIVFNIDKRLKIRVSQFESIALENRNIIVKYAGKEKTLKLGRNEDKYPNLVEKITEKISEHLV